MAARTGLCGFGTRRPANCVATLHGHTGALHCVGLSGDGRLVASGGQDEIVTLWDTQADNCLQRCVVIWCDPLRCVSWDGHWWPAAGRTAWSVCGMEGAGHCLASLEGHLGQVRGVAVSGDGRLVVSCGDDAIIRVWDAATRSTLRTLHSDRHYERLDITGLTGVTEAQRGALFALGAVERELER